MTKFESISSYVSEMLSLYKAAALERARLRCLIPWIRRPFEPLFEHIRCKLGISEDDYMEAAPCDSSICSKSEFEGRDITMSKPIPSMVLMQLSIETIDDCFEDMTKLLYGARVLITNVDDGNCEDPRFKEQCEQLFKEDRVLMEADCSSPRYEDIFLPRSYYDNYILFEVL